MNNLNKIGRLAGKRIKQNGLIDERQLYHPAGVSILHHLSCYNHHILLGLKTKTQKVATIIKNDMTYKPKTRRVERIIAMAKIEKSQTQRVERIVEIEMKHNPKTRRVERIIAIARIERIQTRRVAKIIDKNDVIRSQPRRGIMIIAMAKIVESKTQRVDKIIDEKSEWRNYHPAGVSVPHRLLCYNHNIPLGLKTKF